MPISTNTIKNARLYLSVREQHKALTKELERLEGLLKESLMTGDNKSIDVDGHTISLIEAERRSFDAQALKDLVSASVFKKVTEPTVKTKLLDSAVALGDINTDVLDKIMSVTEYTQLKVK